MRKKTIGFFIIIIMTTVICLACGDSKKEKPNGYEIALTTDVGTIDDKSFNQGAWEGIVQYAEEANKTYKYYKPSEKSDEAFLSAIRLAIKGGAKMVVCPGFLYEVPVYNAQKEYPDVNFIILDGAPHAPGKNQEVEILNNTKSIFFAEHQAGFLAGYAAVQEGYRKLGFIGGIAVPAVVRYGYGYIQGAEQAAKDLGLKEGDITIKYTYVGNYESSPENQAIAASWYNEGTEIIFACGGGVGNSVMKAADSMNKKVIGVDIDQSYESDTVITSAMKNLTKAVYKELASYYNGTFKGGEIVVLDATKEGIQLPMDTSQFNVFSRDIYDELYGKLADGLITIIDDSEVSSADQLPVTYVKVIIS